MTANFKKQSWLSVFFLSLITFMIYVPFWFKKIKLVTDTFSVDKKLNNNLVQALLIVSFVLPVSSMKFNDVSIMFQLFGAVSYVIETILSISMPLLIVFLSFNLRSVLENQYGTHLNAVLTFFLGPMYLQHKINSLIKNSNTEQKPGPDKAATSSNTKKLTNYIKRYEANGYSMQQLKDTLLQQGYQESEVDEAIRLAQQ